MELSRTQSSVKRVSDALRRLQQRNVRLWYEGGKLHYRAPKGTVTQSDRDCLRSLSEEITDIIESGQIIDGLERSERMAASAARYPLTFSQLAHWNLYQLSARSAVRQIASATRLLGRLNVDALRNSFQEIVTSNDAFRTRIVLSGDIYQQEIMVRGHGDIVVEDLTRLDREIHESEIVRIIEDHVLQPIDVRVGPLFGVKLMRVRENEHVLIIVMEHLISDAYSMGVILRKLFIGYVQTVKGEAVTLSKPAVQFAEYAVLQRNFREEWMSKHGGYWGRRLKAFGRVEFPRDLDRPGCRQGWGTVNVTIQGAMKAELLEWCRVRRTTLVMAVFGAYVGLVLRWCGSSDCVIQYQSNGRNSPEIEDTIGYFAAVLYIRATLRDHDSFASLIDILTKEYCTAYQRADASYWAAQSSPPGFTRNTVFNWVPHGTGIDLCALSGTADELRSSPIPFGQPMLKTLDLDHEPVIVLYDSDEAVIGGIHFPLNRFSTDSMQRFARNFVHFLSVLLSQPEHPVMNVGLRN